MTFDARRDIKIHAEQQADGTFTLTSEGLNARSRPELEIVGVPDEAMARYAGMAINSLADSVVEQSPKIGHRIAVASDHGALVALIAESPNAGKRGFGRFFGGGHLERVRIVEPVEGMAPLKTLLSTIMLWKAHAALEEELEDEAITTLQESIAFFPGDISDPEPPDFGVPYNWQNHLAYKELGNVLPLPREALDMAEKALERSAAFCFERIGDTRNAIRNLTADKLATRAELIVEVNCRPTPVLAVNEGLDAVTSPIWRRLPDGETGRRQNIIPKPCVYSSAPLSTKPELRQIAVDLVATHVKTPSVIARIVSSTVDHWEGGSSEAPVLPLAESYQPGDMLLSAALAHVARLYAATMSAEEIRAHVDLGGFDAAHDAARAKYEQLSATESEAIMHAMMGGLAPS